MFTHVSIQSKLIMMMVLCTILAALVVGAMAFQAGRTGLRTAAFDRLIEFRESQSRELEGQLSDLRNSLIIYSNGANIQGALQAFTDGFNQLSAKPPVSSAQWQSVVDYYNGFINQTEQYSGTTLDLSALLPTSNAQRHLQADFTVGKNDPGGAWSAANARYQGFFGEIVNRFEFGDALLLDSRGNVVYSANKGVDLGTNILDGPYSGSKLHGAYLKAMSSNAVDYVTFTDFEFYQPAEMQPTAWMVAPITPGGKAEGALALQFPITKINRLMTFDRRWKEVGLGGTGETFLAGPDELMRSNSRLFLEDPQQFKAEVVAAGTPSDTADMAIRLGGTTLVQPVGSEAVRAALRGQSGTVISTDYLGTRTLQAYAPVVVKDSGLQWVIVATLDTEEAFAKEASFTRTTVLTTTGIVFGVCILAIFLAQFFVRPIRRLEEGTQKISAGDYDVAVPVSTRDEIGDLTAAFNEMSRSLVVKEELLEQQRKDNEQLLNSLMPKDVAERFRQGEETIATEQQHVSVIFSEIIGLDRLQAELDPTDSLTLVNELFHQIDLAADDLGIERVRTVRNGYLASCGLTVPRLDNVRRTVNFALECERIVERFSSESDTDLSFRAGIDTGTVRSGLVGRTSVVYDLWGAAVNMAFQVKNGAPQPGIYASSRVYDTLGDTMTFTEAGTVTFDGERQPIWRVSGRQ